MMSRGTAQPYLLSWLQLSLPSREPAESIKLRRSPVSPSSRLQIPNVLKPEPRSDGFPLMNKGVVLFERQPHNFFLRTAQSCLFYVRVKRGFEIWELRASECGHGFRLNLVCLTARGSVRCLKISWSAIPSEFLHARNRDRTS